jgi:hypothetical protein
MKSSSDNSFIPKRGTSKRKQPGGSRTFYIFSYISYILMCAILLSAGGVYLYQQYTNNKLDQAVENLNAEIESFNQADMERVTQFNNRLSQAQGRLENSISVTAVLAGLQTAIIDTVQINTLSLMREGDEKITIAAEIQTDSFDSTLFQQRVFLIKDSVQEFVISEVGSTVVKEAGQTEQERNSRPAVSFLTTFSLPLEAVPSDPQAAAEAYVSAVTDQDAQEEEINEDII